MAKKKDKKDKEARKARIAEKNLKAQAKGEKLQKKKAKKSGEEEENEQDIDEILAQFKKEQELFEKITIEPVEKPTKRMNATLVSSPVHGKKELILFGGESIKHTPQGQVSTFYNDLYTYSVDSDQWRRITSPNSPLPRSGHAMCVHPSGIILLFGGEFSSPKQSTFYHYGDTWVFDAQAKEWLKVETKKAPLARSGHRMACWKNYILLHGGFRDLSASTTYMNDLWAFDVSSYKWQQIEWPQTMTAPEARSGHSMLPTNEGAIVWGGYSKVKGTKKGVLKGKVHTDTWILKMKTDLKGVRWERRKKGGYAPSPRVGCSMVYHRDRGVLFGGVYDTEETEESLNSVFYNTLYAYQIESNKWFSLSLRSRKTKSNAAMSARAQREKRQNALEETLSELLKDKLDIDKDVLKNKEKGDDGDMEDGNSEDDEPVRREYPIVNKLPHPRFNAATTVLDDQLFIYGGVWENGEREYNLDSMYSVDLGKLDGIKVYWEDLKELEEPTEEEEEGDEEDDDEEEDEDDDEDENGSDEDEDLEEEEEEEEEEDKPIDENDPRPWLPHPKLFEPLKAFYERTNTEFVDWALKQHPNTRGKELKKEAFDLCEDRWWERREEIRAAEDKFESMGGIGDVIEKTTERNKRR